MLRVQALHQEIEDRLKQYDHDWVYARFEDNFMSPEFHARCVADYDRWIKEWDAREVLVGQYREALEALHAEVEMAESVGICLPDRVPALKAGELLSETPPAAEGSKEEPTCWTCGHPLSCHGGCELVTCSCKRFVQRGGSE
jgi:hypothetical protein